MSPGPIQRGCNSACYLDRHFGQAPFLEDMRTDLYQARSLKQQKAAPAETGIYLRFSVARLVASHKTEILLLVVMRSM